jgi:hypothetical protein
MSNVNNVTVTKSANRGIAVLAGDPSNSGNNALYFDDGDSLIITIDASRFAAGTTFNTVTFYPTSDESANAPGRAVLDLSNASKYGAGSATVTGVRINSTNETLFRVTWTLNDLTKPITISDIEGIAANDSAWFSVTMSEPGSPSPSTWTLDPEIVNTSGNQLPGWGPKKPATLQTISV